MQNVITEPIAIIITDGIPMNKILQILFPDGLNPLKVICISLLTLILNITAITAATIWPATVAAAAPTIPSFGAPSRPNISIGSRIILIIAPVPCVIML